MAAMMAAKKSMKFHRMYLLKGRFINSYILFTALRKVVSKEYMKAGKDAMTATTEEHLRQDADGHGKASTHDDEVCDGGGHDARHAEDI